MGNKDIKAKKVGGRPITLSPYRLDALPLYYPITLPPHSTLPPILKSITNPPHSPSSPIHLLLKITLEEEVANLKSVLHANWKMFMNM